MKGVRFRPEKYPTCDVKIKWNERGAKLPTKGACPHCGREFLPAKIRFL